MIKIKQEELPNIVVGLTDIITQSLPIKVAYWIKKLATGKIEKKARDFEKDRMAIINLYGKRDDKGQLVIENHNYVLSDRETFDKEMFNLRNREIEIEFNKIPLSIFGNANVTPASLIALDKFIDEDK